MHNLACATKFIILQKEMFADRQIDKSCYCRMDRTLFHKTSVRLQRKLIEYTYQGKLFSEQLPPWFKKEREAKNKQNVE